MKTVRNLTACTGPEGNSVQQCADSDEGMRTEVCDYSECELRVESKLLIGRLL